MTDPTWHRHCGDLAAEAVAKASGRDIWAEVGGAPRSWRQAAALYRRLGARTLEEVVTALLGPALSPRRATRGDVVMVDGSLGVCRGEVAECMGATVPMRRASKAWRAS